MEGRISSWTCNPVEDSSFCLVDTKLEQIPFVNFTNLSSIADQPEDLLCYVAWEEELGREDLKVEDVCVCGGGGE
jgi:hypothetical protein